VGTPARLTCLFCLAAVVVLLAPPINAQEIEKVQPTGAVHSSLARIPLGVAREFKVSARDFVTFRDPQWGVLTLAQIGAATADAVTSLHNLNRCSSCVETGPSRFFVGEHPDAHKYIIAGIIEVSAEALTGHYLRRREFSRKWYWRMLWTLPQSVSLYEHAQASNHNAKLQ
jgi:hypothetical protein